MDETENLAGYPTAAMPCYACKATAVVQMDGVMQCLSCGTPWYTHQQASEMAQQWAAHRTVVEHKVIHADFKKDRA